MPILTWSPKYSVGVASIDEEHKKLIALINELHDAMIAGRGKDVVGKVLDGLVDYTKKHFALEERLFAQTGYPAAAEHKRAHDELTQQVVEIQEKFRSGKTITISMEVMNFLKDWLVDHILGTDQQYTAHFNSKGIR